jgi:hypothetical protein
MVHSECTLFVISILVIAGERSDPDCLINNVPLIER